MTVPATFELSLQRTNCLGPCPTYIVSIDQSGAVDWLGQACVLTEGAEQEAYTAQQASAVFEALIDGDFWGFRDSYVSADDGCSTSSDSPLVTISLTNSGYDKTIRHSTGCYNLDGLDELVALEDGLDVLLQTDRWVGDRDQFSACDSSEFGG